MDNEEDSGAEVLIENCTVGKDTHSGLAFTITKNFQTYYVPYALTSRRSINRAKQGCDSFMVAGWWARKNGLVE